MVATSKLLEWRDIRTDLVGGMTQCGTKKVYFNQLGDQFVPGDQGSYDFMSKRYMYKY